jgi:hypothetical protein
MKLLFAALFAKIAEFGVKSLDALVNKIIPLATKLEQNKKTIEEGEKAAKQISTLTGRLLLSAIYLTLSIAFIIPAAIGAFFLKILVEKLLIPLATTLSDNHQQIKNASKSALTIAAFTGLMMVTTLFLTVIAKNSLEALLGAAVLIGVVYLCNIAFQTLSTNQQQIYDGALALLAMSGALIVFGFSLGIIINATKDVTFEQVGAIALLTLLFGVTVGILGSIYETVLWGSLVLAVMGISLLVFAPALERICKATKEVTFEQVGVIASIIGALALEVAALGLLWLPMVAGSAVLGIMTASLTPFSITLERICKATKDLTEDDINLVSNSMSILGNGIASMSWLTLPIQMGAVAIQSMGIALYPFVSMLKVLSEIETVPTDSIDDVLSALDKVSSYFKNNSLSFKTIWAAENYMYIMPPFISCVRSLAILKELGSAVPTALVRQSLNAMSLISDFYNGQDMGFFGAIGNRMVASSIVSIIESFVEAVDVIKTLKEMGMIPTGIIRSALNAITMIKNYYEGQDMGFFGAIANRASASSITSIVESFSEAVSVMVTLKEMGIIPTGIIRSALNAITMITDYYNGQDMGFFGAIANRASASSIAGIVESFGEAVAAMVTLKEMGIIPTGLIRSALNSIRTVMNFYNGQKLGFFEGIGARISASMVTGIVESFGEAVAAMGELKTMGMIPTKPIESMLSAIRGITWFYLYVPISYGIDEKCDYIELVVEKFTTMAKKIQDKFNGMKEVDHKSVESLTMACRYITNFYTFTWFFPSEEKITNINFGIEKFIESTKKLKSATIGASSTHNNVKTIVTAMEDILTFFKNSSLNIFQTIKAYRTLSIFERVAAVMTGISNVNTSNISSVGGALTEALSVVDSVDMGQVFAVTNMFNAFNKISKSENIINKFAESVKKFTETCEDLKEALENNNTTINGGSPSGIGTTLSTTSVGNIPNTNGGFFGLDNSSSNKSEGIKIKNVDEMANAIAEKINGALSVDMPDAQIQLLINGSGGNEWTITKC